MAVKSHRENGEWLPFSTEGSNEIKGHEFSMKLSCDFVISSSLIQWAGKAAETLVVGINSNLRIDGQGKEEFKG